MYPYERTLPSRLPSRHHLPFRSNTFEIIHTPDVLLHNMAKEGNKRAKREREGEKKSGKEKRPPPKAKTKINKLKKKKTAPGCHHTLLPGLHVLPKGGWQGSKDRS